MARAALSAAIAASSPDTVDVADTANKPAAKGGNLSFFFSQFTKINTNKIIAISLILIPFYKEIRKLPRVKLYMINTISLKILTKSLN